MKAIAKLKQEPGLDLIDLDMPKISQGEVLVRVIATGICGSDLHVYDWTKGYEWLEPYFPVVLGHEFNGTVIELGPSVENLAKGDRVVVMPGKPCMSCEFCLRGEHNRCSNRRTIGLHDKGSFAEYVAVPAANCFKVADNVSPEVAALAEPMAVALNAVERAEIHFGDTVAVLGPGPIGLLIAFLAKKAGAAKVLLSGRSIDQKRLDIGRQLGAEPIVNVDTQDCIRAALDISRGVGVDHVFEASGSGNAVKSAIQMTRKGGRIILVGIHGAPVEVDLNLLVRQEKSLIGAYGSAAKTWQRVLPALAESAEELRLLITHQVQLAQGVQGFEMAKSPDAVKVVITS